MDDQPFADIAAYTALPRLTGLVLSPSGSRLVATMQQPDAKGMRYSSAIWQIPLDGGDCARLTRSEKGESAPAFLPDDSLLFVSARPDSDGDSDDDEAALWTLPISGEPRVIARQAGGVGGPIVASDAGTVLVTGSRLAWTGVDADDAERRSTRKDRKISAILHTGMPIRYWDHELGEDSPRLLVVDGEQLRDLTPAAGQALHQADASVSADGSTVITSWRNRRRGGRYDYVLVRIDVATGERSTVADEDEISYVGPRLSPDGRRVAVIRGNDGSFDQPMEDQLQLRTLGDDDAVPIDLGDLYPTEWAWSHDSATLFVSGDLHGRGAVLAVDGASGAIVSSLAADAVYSSLCPSPDGRHVYALRSAYDCPPAPVRLDTSVEDQAAEPLPTPAPAPPLPGALVDVGVAMPDGARVRGWLCLPPASEQPAPLMLWIHGGPFASHNSWSWRWNPWVAVARGYAVLMPDPALSTGYGPDWIARAWPHRAGLVWTDLEALLDDVLARPDVDADRTACLGGSFGGYMTNWIAGHTDRFDAIVTHAGLWALDQQHTTTDGAQWKSGLFGTPAERPDWYAANSPHNFVDDIVTPMLIVHGNRDYRVPISEALRLWWDVVSRFTGGPPASESGGPPADEGVARGGVAGGGGEPGELPHRFLQLTGENHWVLSPANAQIWYETVLGFCDQHVRGRPFVPSALL